MGEISGRLSVHVAPEEGGLPAFVIVLDTGPESRNTILCPMRF